MKVGVLRKTTLIHTNSGIVIRVPKGTIVKVDRNVLSFSTVDAKVIKAKDGFYLHMWDSTHKIRFPNGGSIPYPFMML